MPTEDMPTPKPNQRLPWMPFALALILTVGFFTTLGYAMIQGIPPDSKDVVMILIGQMTTVWAGSMGYFFYTTANSARKTEMLAQSPAVKID